MISAALLELVRPLATCFHERGHALFLVGGIVRDELLGRHQGQWSDVDLTTDARPEVTKQLVAPLATAVWTQGERFGTIGCRIGGYPFEITTFRGESYDPSSRKPAVVFADALDIDLSRRDFTINAVAADARTGEVHDPFDGLRDLEQRVLRTPLSADLSFSDDPLRMLRAARFLARFALEPVPDLEDAIDRQRERLRIVSPERVRDELHKLLDVDDPTSGLRHLVRHRLLDPWLPELVQLGAVTDPAHGGIDALTHTLDVVRACSHDRVVRLAALLHDLGKVDGIHDHAARGAALATERLTVLRHANHDVRAVATLVALHHELHDVEAAWTPARVRTVLADTGDLVPSLVELSTANSRARRHDLAERKEFAVRSFVTARLALAEDPEDLEPELDGADIMRILAIGPGPLVGEARRFMFALRVEHGRMGNVAAEGALRAWWAARSD